MSLPDRKIAVVGLGYVGLPAAVALARKFPGVLGFDINEAKVRLLQSGGDPTGELEEGAVASSGMTFTSELEDCASADFYVVAVPTPIDESKRPDLTALRAASASVGALLKAGDIVVYESTVYPGVTEEICGPILAEASGLVCGQDFFLGYSPERINPGDRKHTFERVVKVVSGQTAAVSQIVADVYGAVVDAGVHRASSIRVAEASKVIENIQRDLNIALMNELSIIFNELGIDTNEVLDAASTKWNFIRFFPGLVGGHCIGVDPYYLTTKAQEVGITPEVILAGRRTNDGMGRFVARETVKAMSRAGINIAGETVGVLGLTFKENVQDLRNSRVPDVISELEEFGVHSQVHDPQAEADEALHEYGIELHSLESLRDKSTIILAVCHDGLADEALALVRAGAKVLIDVKAVINPDDIPEGVEYWRL